MRVKDKEGFVKKARQIHGDKYSYDKFEYIKAKHKSIITCEIHGDFLQSPDKHYQAITPCPDCYSERRREIMKGKNTGAQEERRVSKEEYLSRLEERYGDKFTYNLDNYQGITSGEVVLFCDKHKSSTYTPTALLMSEFGCKYCGRESMSKTKTRDYDDFIENARSVHNDFYDYPEENKNTYEDRKSIVKIVCKKHGEFLKRAQKHLSGQGCFRCRIEKLIDDGVLTGGYNKEFFSSNKGESERIGYIYYVKINNGEYFKVGITTELKKRISSLKSMSKSEVEVIDTYSLPLYEAFLIEQDILHSYRESRVYDSWSTELFDKDVLSGVSLEDYYKNKILDENGGN